MYDIDKMAENYKRLYGDDSQKTKEQTKFILGHTFVYNVKDTSDEKWPSDYSSWIDYWEQNANMKCPRYCPVCGERLVFAGERANVNGGHVRLDDEPEDNMAWIVPLCDSCNNWQNNQQMILRGGIWIVRTTMSKTHNTAKPKDGGSWEYFATR